MTQFDCKCIALKIFYSPNVFINHETHNETIPRKHLRYYVNYTQR